jgi:hypothetical protein
MCLVTGQHTHLRGSCHGSSNVLITEVDLISPNTVLIIIGRDSSIVSIATRYRLDGSGSNLGEGIMFHTCLGWQWDPPSLLYHGHRVSFLGVKQSGHPPPYGAKVKERVDLYIYSTSGPSWPVLGRTLPFTIFIIKFPGKVSAPWHIWGLNEK